MRLPMGSSDDWSFAEIEQTRAHRLPLTLTALGYLDHLLEKLRSYREAGFAFDRGFASMGGGEDDESSLALTVPGKTNAAVALGGFISEGEVSMRLEQLRRAVDQIARMT